MEILGSFMPLILIIPIFWFLILRPEQVKRKKHQKMLDNLSKGDQVVTNGGLHGKVVGVDKDIVVITIAEGVKVELTRSAVAFLKKGGELIEGQGTNMIEVRWGFEENGKICQIKFGKIKKKTSYFLTWFIH